MQQPHTQAELVAAATRVPTQRAAADVSPSLSRQEREALGLYLSGLTMDAVARRMGIATCTAKQYIDRVRAKYDVAGQRVRTRHQLFLAAHRDGLLTSSLL